MSDPTHAELRQQALDEGAEKGRRDAMRILMSLSCQGRATERDGFGRRFSHETCIGNTEPDRCLCECHDDIPTVTTQTPQEGKP